MHSRVVVNDDLVDTSECNMAAEEELHADLITMSAHDRDCFTKRTHHAADSVLQKGKVPVLLVRYTNKEHFVIGSQDRLTPQVL